MTLSSSVNGPPQLSEAQRGMERLQQLDTLDIDEALLTPEEQEEHRQHLTNLVEDQASLQERFLQAELDPDVRQELPRELAALYSKRASEREHIGGKGLLYSTFGRTPDAQGTMVSGATLLDESIGRIEETNFPGSDKTAVMLREIAKKLDPEARDENNPYYVLDTVNDVLVYRVAEINKDLQNIRGSIQSILKASLPGDARSQTILTELRRYEATLQGMLTLDPAKHADFQEHQRMNAPDPIGFAPSEALKTALLGGTVMLGIWALTNKNIPYASVMGLLAYLILYGKKQHEFDAQQILSNPDVQQRLVSIAGKGNKAEQAEMIRTLMDRSNDDRKRLEEWIAQGKISDESVDEIEDPALRGALKEMTDSQDRIRWISPLLKLKGKDLEEVITTYIEGATV